MHAKKIPKNTKNIETFQKKDQQEEIVRYTKKAKNSLFFKNKSKPMLGAQSIPQEIRDPYETYESLIFKYCKKNAKVLDLCCGLGAFSFVSSVYDPQITLLDIVPKNVELACLLAKKIGVIAQGEIANVEQLPFSDETFDLITCAGGLSYFERKKGFQEIRRVLKPRGIFLCVDSLNHNPVYRFNRWLHYLKKQRSKSTLDRMPTIQVFKEFEDRIGTVVQKRFFGIFIMLAPLLKIIFGADRASFILRVLDKKFSFLCRHSFKFVAVIQKIN